MEHQFFSSSVAPTSISLLVVAALSFGITSRYYKFDKNWFHGMKRIDLIIVLLILVIILSPILVTLIMNIPLGNQSILIYLEELFLSLIFLISSLITWRVLGLIITFTSKVLSLFKSDNHTINSLFINDIRLGYPLPLVSDLYYRIFRRYRKNR